MSFARYALGIAALGCVCGSLGIAAVALRARLLPGWRGAPARLAESVVGFALLVGVLELLGTIGLFRLAPIVLACALVGAGVVRMIGWPGRTADGAVRARAAVTGPMPRAVAAVVTGLVFAEWAVPTLHSYDVGIRAFDSLWYHLPWAATFAQTGHITSLHFTDVEYLTAFYPATAELLHGLGIVLLGRDVLSPGLNLVFLGLVLLAAWCVGRPRGIGAATLIGAAVALATPMMRFSQAGSAANDVVGVFFLVAAVGLLANADGGLGRSGGIDGGSGRAGGGGAGGVRAALGLAGVSAGLAVSVKLSLLAPVLALTLGAVAIAPRGRRRELGGLWLSCLIVAGGFWYLRNLIAVGNPLPWTSLGIFATPAPALQAHTAFSVLHYLGDGHIWSRILAPGLTDGLGSLWPVIAAAAILGPLACLGRGSDRLARVLGLVALASLIAYLITPESAAGPRGHPTGFAFNLRYCAPALTLALVLVPLATERLGDRARHATLGALAALLAVVLAQSRLWTAGYVGPAALVGVLAAGLVLLPIGRRRLGSRRVARPAIALLAVAGALLAAGAALGYAGERHYLRGRYLYEPRVSSLATLWQWFRGVHHARVAMVGTFGGFFAYPLYGLDDSNRVQYVARRGPHGSFSAIDSCRQWRAALASGAYRYLVTTPGRDPWRPRVLLPSPEGAWTASDPSARVVFRSRAAGQPISVYELRGRPDPAGCPAR